MKYLTVDAYIRGTGIRDAMSGEYLNPKSLNISSVLKIKLHNWLENYWSENLHGYKNQSIVEFLDTEGLEIALALFGEVKNCKIQYYSDANMKKYILIDGKWF